MHPWLAPLVLPGGQALPNRILPGPMEGITAGSFVRVMTAMGLVRCWVTPFVRISNGVPRLCRLRERLAAFLDVPSVSPLGTPVAGAGTGTGTAAKPPMLPVVVQIMGTDTALLAAAAARVEELGVAGVDLNCACPAKEVLHSGAGGMCLCRPEWIRTTLCALRAACPGIGVSVKLRTGYADSAELPAILAAVRAAAPDFVTLHFRTVEEMYRPVPGGWARLAQARALLPETTLIGSGDVRTAQDAQALCAETGVDGVAPARGLLHYPWLLQDIEAVLAGAEPRRHDVTERRAFLGSIVRCAEADGSWRPGFILELAKNLFGRETPCFAALAAARSAREMLACLA